GDLVKETDGFGAFERLFHAHFERFSLIKSPLLFLSLRYYFRVGVIIFAVHIVPAHLWYTTPQNQTIFIPQNPIPLPPYRSLHKNATRILERCRRNPTPRL